ncbi:hypothetical protein AAG570_014107 [Ranatra chinensis]|uniref:Uncharacterized protein n=1 Tax=Ranatra chinensis TaxID=642074 RepID=A0ABD0XU01_9HEMI
MDHISCFPWSVVFCSELVGPNRFRLTDIFSGASESQVMSGTIMHKREMNYDPDSPAEDGEAVDIPGTSHPAVQSPAMPNLRILVFAGTLLAAYSASLPAADDGVLVFNGNGKDGWESALDQMARGGGGGAMMWSGWGPAGMTAFTSTGPLGGDQGGLEPPAIPEERTPRAGPQDHPGYQASNGHGSDGQIGHGTNGQNGHGSNGLNGHGNNGHRSNGQNGHGGNGQNGHGTNSNGLGARTGVLVDCLIVCFIRVMDMPLTPPTLFYMVGPAQ